GSSAYCDTLADTNSMAEAFLHAATQAPPPIHIAESKARSLLCLRTRLLFASGAAPAVTEMNPPATWILSIALRSTIRSLITGNGFARHGSMVMVSPSLKYLIER